MHALQSIERKYYFNASALCQVASVPNTLLFVSHKKCLLTTNNTDGLIPYT